MTVREAKAVAARWVREEGAKTAGFQGAYFHGSVNWMADDAELPPTSDLDLMLVLEGDDQPSGRGKFRYGNVLLEVSHLPAEQLRTPAEALSRYQLTGSLATTEVVADPGGWLTDLQKTVARNYARREWVEKRCDAAEENSRRFLASNGEDKPLHDRVSSWLFGTGVTTHVLLVAGLKNPTVRQRYRAARELLREYDHLDFYEELLELLGCAPLTPSEVADSLDAMTRAFDTARTCLVTPYRFSADLSEDARPVAVGGSAEMIQNGDHREAVFWMLATYSRCQHVLAMDAPPEVQAEHTVGYRAFLATLGLAHPDSDLPLRCHRSLNYLPPVREVAGKILRRNPAIVE